MQFESAIQGKEREREIAANFVSAGNLFPRVWKITNVINVQLHYELEVVEINMGISKGRFSCNRNELILRANIECYVIAKKCGRRDKIFVN